MKKGGTGNCVRKGNGPKNGTGPRAKNGTCPKRNSSNRTVKYGCGGRVK